METKNKDLWLPEAGEGVERELEERSEKAQTCSYKINTTAVMHSMVTIASIAVWHIGKLLEWILKVSSQERKFSFFPSFFLLYPHKKMDSNWTYCVTI